MSKLSKALTNIEEEIGEGCSDLDAIRMLKDVKIIAKQLESVASEMAELSVAMAGSSCRIDEFSHELCGIIGKFGEFEEENLNEN